MKSPVPVVMSYIGTCSPSRSTPVTRRPSPVSTAAVSIDRRVVTAGSVGWKNRSAPPTPPRTPAPPPPRPAPAPARRFPRVAESEGFQREHQPAVDRRIGRSQPQDPVPVAPVRVEDTRQEALVPVRSRIVRPVQQPAERPHLFGAAGGDRRPVPAPGMARRAGLVGQAEADAPDARPG